MHPEPTVFSPSFRPLPVTRSSFHTCLLARGPLSTQGCSINIYSLTMQFPSASSFHAPAGFSPRTSCTRGAPASSRTFLLLAWRTISHPWGPNLRVPPHTFLWFPQASVSSERPPRGITDLSAYPCRFLQLSKIGGRRDHFHVVR